MAIHRFPMTLAFALCLALAACKPTSSTPASGGSAAPRTESAAATCPDADFDAFLARFSRDIAVQEKATADPLTQGRIDNEAQPEPRPVTTDVPLADVQWPVIPNLEAVKKGGREVVISSKPDGSREVLVRTPDSDDQQRYVFAERPCWTLVRTDDDTL